VVSGQVTDEAGKPLEPLDAKDVALQPPLFVPYPGGRFKLNIYSWPDENGKMEFPVLSVSHNGFDSHPLDLDPNVQNDVEIKRVGQSITLKQIKLHPQTAQYQPSKQAPVQVPYAAEAQPANQEPHP
jgi:hypothetical protein